MSIHASRRAFLKTGTFSLLASAMAPRLLAAESPKLFSSVGIAGPLDKAAMFKAAGAEFITASVGNFLVPDKSEKEFEKNLEEYSDLPIPILACNGFIRPSHLKCIGPKANHDLVLEWSETTFRRMKRAGGKFIVFGSSGARKVPKDWPKEKADEQFVSLLKRMGTLAKEHDVTVTIEQLRKDECNYINRISEGAAIIRAADHPNVRLLADLYHMASMGDTPEDLKAAMDVVVHMEIAEKKKRSLPGVEGDDFRPYLRVLRETNYKGALSIEGRWKDEHLAPAFKEIAKQAGEV